MSGIMSMLLGARTAIAAAVDEFFNRVTLLLPGNGTNGAQNNTFLDSSSNNFTITRNGNTTQGTFSPFSQTGWGTYLGSASNNIVAIYLNGESDFAFGTSDFTIELWINISKRSALTLVYDSRPDLANGLYPTIYVDVTDKLKFYVNSADRITQTSTFTYNVWHHVVVTRTGTSTKMFVDGVQEGSTYTDSNNYINGALRPVTGDGFNPNPTSNSSGVVGYISNLRVVKGSGPYQSAGSSITVPTSPLTPVTNTVLLTLQSSRFVDTNTQATAKTINLYNGPTIQAFSPFLPTTAYSAGANGGSGYFDGNGDYLTGNGQLSSSTSMSTFTVEGWIYPTTFANTIWVVGDMQATSNVNSLAVNIGTNGDAVLYWFDGAVKTCTSTTFMRLNQWNWFAIVVNSNAISIYVNSTTPGQAGTTTLTNRTQTTNFSVGQYNGSTTPNGYIGSLRWSNGIARTISSIPTAPYTSDANTRLLLNFTNAGITDATSKNVLETVGNAQISTAQSKFGGSSMYFDGTGDNLFARSQQDLSLGGGDFTVEAWVYPTVSATQGIIGFGNGNTVQPYLYLNGLTPTFLYNMVNVATGGALTINSWNHVAVTRSGTTIRVFTNGTSGTAVSPYSDVFTNAGIYIGSSNSGTQYFTGYMDDLRVTRGFARYTANFTPPTAAFPLQ